MSRAEVIPPRYEFKYLVTEDVAQAMRRALPPFCVLDRHSAKAKDHQNAIQSLYLDTPGRDLYWQSRSESHGRIKVRVRAYGDSPAFLELKRKSHGIVRKSRARVARTHWVERVQGVLPDHATSFERDFRVQVDRHLLEPATLVRYQREAWEGAFDSYARVTFDRAITFQPVQTLTLDGDPSAWQPMDDARSTMGIRRAVVLELKSGLDLPQWMQRLIERFGLFRQSYSKYCLSIERSAGRKASLPLPPTVPTWSL